MCELLSVLCSPDMNAVQHLEMKQVSEREDEGGEGGDGSRGGRKEGERWVMAV